MEPSNSISRKESVGSIGVVASSIKPTRRPTFSSYEFERADQTKNQQMQKEQVRIQIQPLNLGTIEEDGQDNVSQHLNPFNI
jgi:hypothetical protein